MAKVIGGESLFLDLRGPNSKYPWSEWLDGKKRVLVQEKDFTVSPVSFRTVAYVAARLRGMRIAFVKGDKEGEFLFQAEKMAK